MFSKTRAIILCGGLGSRLRPVLTGVPKVLAPLGGRPLLDILLSFLKRQGIQNVILATGYGSEQIRKHCALSPIVKVIFSEESTPLGTGGALKKAASLVAGDYIFVLNGDTLCELDYADFFEFHLAQGALASIAVGPRNREDSGGVKIGTHNLILGYQERPRDSRYPFMSAGSYLLSKAAIALMPRREVFSLEHDFFPKLVKSGQCFGYVTHSPIIDIGTPERYLAAATSLPNLQLT